MQVSYSADPAAADRNGRMLGAEQRLFAPFCTKSHHFSKTGSGQTKGKLKTKTRFLTGHAACAAIESMLPPGTGIEYLLRRIDGSGIIEHLWSPRSERWFWSKHGSIQAETAESLNIGVSRECLS
jgi:hypothetical protein